MGNTISTKTSLQNNTQTNNNNLNNSSSLRTWFWSSNRKKDATSTTIKIQPSSPTVYKKEERKKSGSDSIFPPFWADQSVNDKNELPTSEQSDSAATRLKKSLRPSNTINPTTATLVYKAPESTYNPNLQSDAPLIGPSERTWNEYLFPPFWADQNWDAEDDDDYSAYRKVPASSFNLKSNSKNYIKSNIYNDNMCKNPFEPINQILKNENQCLLINFNDDEYIMEILDMDTLAAGMSELFKKFQKASMKGSKLLTKLISNAIVTEKDIQKNRVKSDILADIFINSIPKQKSASSSDSDISYPSHWISLAESLLRQSKVGASAMRQFLKGITVDTQQSPMSPASNTKNIREKDDGSILRIIQNYSADENDNEDLKLYIPHFMTKFTEFINKSIKYGHENTDTLLKSIEQALAGHQQNVYNKNDKAADGNVFQNLFIDISPNSDVDTESSNDVVSNFGKSFSKSSEFPARMKETLSKLMSLDVPIEKILDSVLVEQKLQQNDQTQGADVLLNMNDLSQAKQRLKIFQNMPKSLNQFLSAFLVFNNASSGHEEQEFPVADKDDIRNSISLFMKVLNNLRVYPNVIKESSQTTKLVSKISESEPNVLQSNLPSSSEDIVSKKSEVNSNPNQNIKHESQGWLFFTPQDVDGYFASAFSFDEKIAKEPKIKEQANDNSLKAKYKSNDGFYKSGILNKFTAPKTTSSGNSKSTTAPESMRDSDQSLGWLFFTPQEQDIELMRSFFKTFLKYPQTKNVGEHLKVAIENLKNNPSEAEAKSTQSKNVAKKNSAENGIFIDQGVNMINDHIIELLSTLKNKVSDKSAKSDMKIQNQDISQENNSRDTVKLKPLKHSYFEGEIDGSIIQSIASKEEKLETKSATETSSIRNSNGIEINDSTRKSENVDVESAKIEPIFIRQDFEPIFKTSIPKVQEKIDDKGLLTKLKSVMRDVFVDPVSSLKTYESIHVYPQGKMEEHKQESFSATVETQPRKKPSKNSRNDFIEILRRTLENVAVEV